MNYKEEIEKIIKDRDQAAQNIANLQAFIHQCNGKLIVLNDLVKEEQPTTPEQE